GRRRRARELRAPHLEHQLGAVGGGEGAFEDRLLGLVGRGLPPRQQALVGLLPALGGLLVALPGGAGELEQARELGEREGREPLLDAREDLGDDRARLRRVAEGVPRDDLLRPAEGLLVREIGARRLLEAPDLLAREDVLAPPVDRVALAERVAERDVDAPARADRRLLDL